MFNQKGQILVVALIVLVVGFVIYANLADKSLFKSFLPSSPGESSSGVKTKISAPSKQEKELSPTVVSSLTPSGADIAPPKRLNPRPKDKSVLPAETRQITLGLETDEKAACRYGEVSGIYYNFMQGDFEQTNGTIHSALITALNGGGKYKYYIRCQDAAGNTNIDDFIISFEVKLPEDKTTPILANPSHQGNALPFGTKEVVISISTDEEASCRYSANAGTAYSGMPGRLSQYDQSKRLHIKNITGLQDGKTYDYFVRCQDLKGNANTGDLLISFKVGE